MAAPTSSKPALGAPTSSKPALAAPTSSKLAKLSYSYIQLASATEEQGVRNVWASVVECSIPRPTKGTGESFELFRESKTSA